MYDVLRQHDQVWFKLQITPEFCYGAVYIPPSDSPYHSPKSFALIHNHCTEGYHKSVIIGDVNARICDLTQFNDQLNHIHYAQNVDIRSNKNGKSLSNVCRACDLTPVNHLVYKDKAFVVVSLSNIIKTRYLSTIKLPTNHAAIALQLKCFHTPVSNLLKRANQLGASHEQQTESNIHPIPMHTIDPVKFPQTMPTPDDLWTLEDETSTFCSNISDCLYDTARRARQKCAQWNYTIHKCW